MFVLFEYLIVATVVFIIFYFVLIPIFLPKPKKKGEPQKVKELNELKEKEQELKEEIVVTKEVNEVKKTVEELEKELEQFKQEKEKK